MPTQLLRRRAFALSVAGLVAFAPIIIALVGAALVELIGCYETRCHEYDLGVYYVEGCDEVDLKRCEVLGVNIGPSVGFFTQAGIYVSLLTMPAGAVLAGIWIAWITRQGQLD